MAAASATGMANWKNVNNWHWVDKNCINWAKDYFKRELETVSAEKDDGTCKVWISSMSDLTGDVDLNQRKGKIITIYDVQMNLLWKGETKNGIKANGKINIPEFMHDTETDEIVFDISMEAETKEKDAAFKKFLKEKLLPLLRSKMSRFSADLIDAHKSDVYVEPENKIATNMTTSSYSPKPPAPDQFGVAAKPAGVVGGVAKISMSLEFVCSVADLYQTLTDANRVKMWTRGPANMEAFVTGNFSLFDGNISGSILELVPNKKIVQKWRLRSWAKDHFSTVTIELDDKGDCCTLKLTQDQVPVGDKDNTTKNWHQYYWNPIKSTFGFGAIL